MVNWNNVRLIYLREVRDQLRDRRTLFMIAILPLLLYPALGIGMLQLTLVFAQQARTVVLLGAADLPAQPVLLEGSRFASTWFLHPANSERLEVVSDADPLLKEPGSAADRVRRLVAEAEELRAALARQRAADAALERLATRWKGHDAFPIISETPQRAHHDAAGAADAAAVQNEVHGQTPHVDVAASSSGSGAAAGHDDVGQVTVLGANPSSRPAAETFNPRDGTTRANARAEVARLILARQEAREHLGRLFARSQMQALILIPHGFGQHIESTGRLLAEGDADVLVSSHYERPEILYNKADDKSEITYARVRAVLDEWESAILKQQLVLAKLPEEFPHPVKPTENNVALDEQIAGNVWSKVFPALLVIMAVTGAFYPAIDIVAGEKERGTMETLLICPATRVEIVLGKFLTVMSFSCATALLNLLSMGATGRHMASLTPGGVFSRAGDLGLPPWSSLLWVLVLLLPLASLFSALCLALATFARSSKEGQYYLTPLLMVTLGLTVFCLSPGVELRPQYSVLPVAGIALLLKGLLLSPLQAGHLYVYVLPVLLTSLAYSALALWWAIDQFNREDVLFREAERFDVRLWVRHLLRDKEPLPSFTEAGFCFVLIMLLQFLMMGVLNQRMLTALGTSKVLLVQQIAIIGSPALFMALMLTSSFRRTLRLRRPAHTVWLVALLLPVALHPLSVTLQQNLEWFFGPLPEHLQVVLRSMSDPHQPLWLTLLTFSVAPALCEEVAFRGFILSGFSQRGRVWLAIVLSSLCFGLMHMIPKQAFNAALLGLVLGLLAIRGGSLYACIVFHALYNTLAIFYAQLGESSVPAELGLLISKDAQGTIHYRWPVLLICAVMSVGLLRWMLTWSVKDVPAAQNAGPVSPASQAALERGA